MNLRKRLGLWLITGQVRRPRERAGFMWLTSDMVWSLWAEPRPTTKDFHEHLRWLKAHEAVES